ncbi:MAG: OB-fold nucleic acid binding domain-containing protein, partial [Defluviitaleaceae bacterium]|nr:OB-fold nucleic acid binding domain-containing protein [Defluviitaleaceae bacterium]
LLPPDVNEGHAAFSVSEKNIRFGLSSIKNVGAIAVDAIVSEREKNGKYKSLTDFIRRLADKDVNKRCLESLIRAGAFDSLGGKRSQYIAIFQNIQNGFAQQKKNILEGQLSLFDLDATEKNETSDADELPQMGEFPKRLRLFDEKTLLGIYVSGHPLAEFEETIRPHVNVSSVDFAPAEDENEPALGDGDNVKYGGIITGKSVKYTKAENKAFCFLTVEDMFGAVEVIVFSKIYEKFGARLQEDQVLVIQGRVNVREEEATKLVAQDFLFYEEMPHISVSSGKNSSHNEKITRNEKNSPHENFSHNEKNSSHENFSHNEKISSRENFSNEKNSSHEKFSNEKNSSNENFSNEKNSSHENFSNEKKLKTTFWIKIPKDKTVSPKNVTDILAAHPGDTEVMIYNEAENKKIRADGMFFVTPNDALKLALENLLGDETVKITQK